MWESASVLVREFRHPNIGPKFLHEVLLFCHMTHLAENGRRRGEQSRHKIEQHLLDIILRTRDDVLAALLWRLPRLPDP